MKTRTELRQDLKRAQVGGDPEEVRLAEEALREHQARAAQVAREMEARLPRAPAGGAAQALGEGLVGIESLRRLLAEVERTLPLIHVGAWRVLPWVEPLAFESVGDFRYPSMVALKPAEPSFRVVGYGPIQISEPALEQVVLTRETWKEGHRVAAIYVAAGDERPLAALGVFRLAMRLFTWMDRRVPMFPWLGRG